MRDYTVSDQCLQYLDNSLLTSEHNLAFKKIHIQHVANKIKETEPFEKSTIACHSIWETLLSRLAKLYKSQCHRGRQRRLQIFQEKNCIQGLEN